MSRQQSNVAAVRNEGADRAVVFVHGYNGQQNDTWDLFPTLVGSGTRGLDIFTLGYATTLLPDIVGVWSADPDLPILATLLCTEVALKPLERYKALTLIAHSMGGLVVQKALVDDPQLAARVENVILFGTPSAGLRKAKAFSFWKRQLENMALGSPFIERLRAAWKERFEPRPPFNLLAVAGTSDQFVPPASSLDPFDASVRRAVPGDHIAIVKPATADAPSVALVIKTLESGNVPAPDKAAEVRLAAEQPTGAAPALVDALLDSKEAVSWKDIVDAALALDRAGQRQQSIELLDRYKERDTDIKGSLGGRYKRLWFETGNDEHAKRALTLYSEALATAQRHADSKQIYYLAINVAFMNFAYVEDNAAAREMAALAMQHAWPPGDDVWKTATVAEAHLYFGRTREALAEYRRLLTLDAPEWQYKSAGLQAGRIAAKLGDRELVEALDAIFSPEAREANRIFVSYSHEDKAWLKRLVTMLAPYLRDPESELKLWVDTDLKAGQQWDPEIRNALERAGVAVALVSKDFLASAYVVDYELPAMIAAAKKGDLQLLWVYISSAAWKVTPLKNFQATHDTKTPLSLLRDAEQDEVLLSVAEEIKAASLRATGQFKKRVLPPPPPSP